MILSDDYQKKSYFEIFINDEKIPYTKNHKFQNIGNYIVKYKLYEEINIDNMFKNISSLISINLASDRELLILSMQNTFENCVNLEDFIIEGFNLDNIISLKNLFLDVKI